MSKLFKIKSKESEHSSLYLAPDILKYTKWFHKLSNNAKWKKKSHQKEDNLVIKSTFRAAL